MVMDNLINSGVLTLIVVLLSVIAIVFLFLKFRQDKDGSSKIHIYYISGLLIFIIIELVTYICVNNGDSDQIVNYISFASTISSLFLSVVAIIYAIVSNNKGDIQYQKIDQASGRISSSVEKFSTMSENLSNDIDAILSKLEEIKSISDETRQTINQNFQSYANRTANKEIVEQIVDGYVNSGSYYGNLSLLACVYSYKMNRPFAPSELFPDATLYAHAYIVASTALGVITTHVSNDKFIVDNVIPTLQEKTEAFIKRFIEEVSRNGAKADNQKLYDSVKKFFDITDK